MLWDDVKYRVSFPVETDDFDVRVTLHCVNLTPISVHDGVGECSGIARMRRK